ncbi:Protein AF-17 [Xenoophorus captivus]|uniref:Protein AF-17 n=1 Tax=Xenoophorus captivus TaxID=1517983 RepID=A0ABV0RM51_9TELE
MREMVGGCCVCSDERGWAENPLVYCDGHGCSVAGQAGLLTPRLDGTSMAGPCVAVCPGRVPTGPWFCRKCESQERAARVVSWAHVVCALYIPEVQFANVLTMEPIILQYVPHERYLKVQRYTSKKEKLH